MNLSRRCGACGADIPEPRKSWGMFLPLEPPSQNLVAQNKGAGRHAYRRLRDDFRLLIASAGRAQRIPIPTGRRRVFVLRLYSGRGKRRDRDNLVGGCKPLIDAIVSTGLVLEDDPDHLEAHYQQARTEDRAGTMLLIEDP